ncbi:FadR/GntR family transcriptional regulator [Arthrobacter psychrolactophilus]|uniref:FadR/GntR family transcriptional regulator n=1 Tax=Arthrobacter psychrolactophilus TaxID=92442 RepID=UPI001FEBF072|nr:FCD domain-containing protein [Arthrobacter psychrolactophilus]
MSTPDFAREEPTPAPVAPWESAAHGARSYDAVLASIEVDLRQGKIKVGDQLPGERALALRHGISRASVRDAIRVLDAMGVVRTGVGSGPQSGTVVIANPSAGLASTLRLHMATNHFPVADIVQTRVMMETWAAVEAAASPRSAEQVSKLRGALTAMAAPGLSREAFHVLDAAFHVYLSSLAGNAVVTSMMESLRSAIQGYVGAAITSDDHWETMVPTLRQQHEDIVAAVIANDGGAAAAALKSHIEWFHQHSESAPATASTPERPQS